MKYKLLNQPEGGETGGRQGDGEIQRPHPASPAPTIVRGVMVLLKQ
jgi:hypothetical protein